MLNEYIFPAVFYLVDLIVPYCTVLCPESLLYLQKLCAVDFYSQKVPAIALIVYATVMGVVCTSVVLYNEVS